MRDADLLRPLLLEGRAARLDAVLAARLRGVTVVLEHLRDEGNVSAVLRTCEALGVQDVYVIESAQAPFRVVTDITQGCERWLDVHRSGDASACLDSLRARGFRLYGAYLGEEAVELGALGFRDPVALVFGNEKSGISEETRIRCDRLYRIPMLGMTRSLNVSVAAALSLHHAVTARRAAVGRPGDLGDEDLAALRDRWYREEVRDPERVLDRLRARDR
jgi:tRNA (guanosine-2'-O-)-methyltransferase